MRRSEDNFFLNILNENKNTTYENQGDTTKVTWRGKFMALNVYIRKRKSLKSIISKLLPQEPRKRTEKKKKLKVSIRGQKAKRAQVNEIEKRKTTENNQ